MKLFIPLLSLLSVVTAAAQQEARPERSSVIASLESQFVASLAPSPDGRWLAFDISASTGSGLSIVPASGGSPRTLAPRAERASMPVWFRDGTRLAYYSDRLPGILVSAFDPASGTLVGLPRRVTIEPAFSFDVSPDGQWIAYATRVRRAHNVIRLVPARGGPARTLLDRPGFARSLRFSPDGRYVYFTRWTGTRRFEVHRVAVADGSVRVMRSRPHLGEMDMVAEPAHARILELSGGRFVVVTFEGDTLASLPAGDGLSAEATFDMRLSPDGRWLLVAATDVGASIRAFSTRTADARELSDASAYYWPVGWSSDGRRVFYADSNSVWSAPLAGGEADVRRFSPAKPLPDTLSVNVGNVSDDGRHWLMSQRAPAPRAMYLYDSRTRAVRELTTKAGNGTPKGPGGGYFSYRPASGEFMYVDRTPDGIELRAARPNGTSRVIRAIGSDERYGPVTVHGERVAWISPRNDSSVILVATGRGAPRAVWSSDQRIEDLVWSHDGRSMAALLDMPSVGGQGRLAIVFLSLDPDGNARETARTRSIYDAWDVYWTPDDRALLLLEFHGAGDTRVMRVPAHASGPFTYVIPQGLATFWDYFLSPDGSQVVVPAEQYRGSSILRIDIAAAERAFRQSRPRH